MPIQLAFSLPSGGYSETRSLFAAYERKFWQAAENLQVRRPWVDQERQEILSLAKCCLGIRIPACWTPTSDNWPPSSSPS